LDSVPAVVQREQVARAEAAALWVPRADLVGAVAARRAGLTRRRANEGLAARPAEVAAGAVGSEAGVRGAVERHVLGAVGRRAAEDDAVSDGVHREEVSEEIAARVVIVPR